MSTLSRSNTLVNGEIRDKGMSGQQIAQYTYNSRLPVLKGDRDTRAQSLTDGDNVHRLWELRKNTTVDDVGTLSEFAASNTKDLWKRVKMGGKRHRPSRKYKKSAKRVFRKKSRATRRR